MRVFFCNETYESIVAVRSEICENLRLATIPFHCVLSKMRKLIFVPIYFLVIPFAGFSQDKKDDPGNWTTQFAYTKQYLKDSTGNKRSDLQGFGIRFISPNFKIETEDEYWTEEKEKHPEKFKRARFFCELMYAPKHQLDDLTDVTEFSTNVDLTYSILHVKRFNLDAVGGYRLFFQYSPGYGLINFKKVSYWDCGAAAQLDLGFVVPFIEVRRFVYCTAGIEVRLHPVYKKPKRKYNIHKKLFRVR